VKLSWMKCQTKSECSVLKVILRSDVGRMLCTQNIKKVTENGHIKVQRQSSFSLQTFRKHRANIFQTLSMCYCEARVTIPPKPTLGSNQYLSILSLLGNARLAFQLELMIRNSCTHSCTVSKEWNIKPEKQMRQ